MARTWDIIDRPIQRGADFRRVITYTHAGQPVNLAGCTARWVLLGNDGSKQVFRAQQGVVVSNAAQGEITIDLDADTTAGISFYKGEHRLFLNFPNSQVKKLLSGQFKVQD